MDHFAGFDQLLRVRHHQPGRLRVIGPPGLIAGIAAKIAANTGQKIGQNIFILKANVQRSTSNIQRSIVRAAAAQC